MYVYIYFLLHLLWCHGMSLSDSPNDTVTSANVVHRLIRNNRHPRRRQCRQRRLPNKAGRHAHLRGNGGII